jgi:S-adenosylmethionine:tRNA ribosyltransferase-isomerase
MQQSDFDFLLPDELIAQKPLADRTASRLMVLDRQTGRIEHRRFADLPGLLSHGDLLVRNETRVIPARLYGQKETGGQVEVLLVQRQPGAEEVWVCLTRSSKPMRPGSCFELSGGIHGEVLAVDEEGRRKIRFDCEGDFYTKVDAVGHMPLPPYIRRADTESDKERYQTVFAQQPGAVAAPTAGLHFSDETFSELGAHGVDVCGLTLHVGLGTFQPIRTDNLMAHRMHGEVFEVPVETAERVNVAHAEDRRVVALGTTCTRTLEYAVDGDGRLAAGKGVTDLFIYPGFRFQLVDALVTNFHLPQSTLLMLVAAFAGKDFVLEAYREAVAQKYRFFSYGDCMLIL